MGPQITVLPGLLTSGCRTSIQEFPTFSSEARRRLRMRNVARKEKERAAARGGWAWHRTHVDPLLVVRPQRETGHWILPYRWGPAGLCFSEPAASHALLEAPCPCFAESSSSRLPDTSSALVSALPVLISLLLNFCI